ncbi:opsin-5-like [Ammospiza caudacuta]|uniref:opsin-5-like n=1 Tax=Ammospiza caudacuta TaxID=2857398 RepID=UPI00273A1D2B|nr:opsin-5-like [Ammospiza caudacuta]
MGNASNTSAFASTLSEREDLIFGTLYLVFGIMSLSGNSLLLLVAHQKRSLLKPAELFIVNLAISDLSMTVTLFPLAASSLFAHRWLFDQAVCTLYAFCGVLFGLSSLASLTALSTVCCLKVCYPAYGSRFSHGHAMGLLLAVWAYALAFAAAPLARWGSYGPEPYGTACCVTWEPSSKEATLYILALLICCYLLPCLLILASYALILWTVWASRRALRRHRHMCPQRGNRGLHGLLLRLSITVCLGFLAAWTPYAVLALWALLGDASQVPALAFVLSAVFAKSSTLYNPLVCLLLKPTFHRFLSRDRAPLLQALCTLLCCACRGTVLQPGPARGRRSCSDVPERLSACPRCCTAPRLPGSPARRGALAVLAGRAAGQPGLRSAVQVMVLLTRRCATATLYRQHRDPATPCVSPGPSRAVLPLPFDSSLQKGTGSRRPPPEGGSEQRTGPQVRRHRAEAPGTARRHRERPGGTGNGRESPGGAALGHGSGTGALCHPGVTAAPPPNT